MTGPDLDVAVIAAMSNAEIRQAWERVYEISAPAITPSLLARDLAHRAQLAASGGIDRRLERKLRELTDRHADAAGSSPAPRPRLAAGSQLLREWGGQTHRVIVEEGGSFLYASKRWSSLSAIARAITGARWSGPRFFGTDT